MRIEPGKAIRRSGSLVLLSLAIGVAAPSADGDPVLYSQPLNTNTASLLNLPLASQNDPSVFPDQVPFARAYDDYIFASGAIVTDVHWTGSFFTGEAAPDSITGFEIQFWSDAGNAPPPFGPPPTGSPPLHSVTIIGTASQTLIGTCGVDSLFPCFTYSATISPFVAAPETRYWLSIVADLPFPPQWGLAAGTGGNGISHIDFLGVRDPPAALLGDLAWQLTGTPLPPREVPEPATLMLLLALGLARCTFRRRSAADTRRSHPTRRRRGSLPG